MAEIAAILDTYKVAIDAQFSDRRVRLVPAAATTPTSTGATTTSPSTAAIRGVLFEVDSITFGAGLQDGQQYPKLIGASAGIPVMNDAYVGDTLANAFAKYDQQDAPKFNGSSLNTISILGGINDILSNGSTDVVLRDVITQFVAKAKATGFVVVLCTLTPVGTKFAASVTAAQQGYVTAYNAWLRANYLSIGADYLVDFAAIPEAQDPASTTYYQDQLHPMAPLAALMAAKWRSTLAAALPAQSITAAPADDAFSVQAKAGSTAGQVTLFGSVGSQWYNVGFHNTTDGRHVSPEIVLNGASTFSANIDVSALPNGPFPIDVSVWSGPTAQIRKTTRVTINVSNGAAISPF
ncbi:SGNH/GDSL hydrolase family protein [Methylobacterium mesophilicum]|uniref:SGNH/GDSL hydrolase family protein n=1 Tax=Methylobacterium TaxID=407 RepID=UPI0011C759DB|nr:MULTISPECIES: GDSL-type esterase/lipase family protein [Methylobacterium]TXN38580.1 hypothetical protein FV233_29010 [Methylobacterium sp. WL7]GJE23610.1 hypothetical protein JHFBIEKO_4073 [Methylobacterium mesophilicum]